MKHFIILLVVLTQISCATQNSSSQEDHSMKDLIKNGQPVYIENQTITETIDFTSFVNAHLISDGIYQTNITSGITFKKCVFKMPISAFKKTENGVVTLTSFKGNVSFIDCIFKAEVNFRGSSIEGRMDFTASTFNEAANFEEINCHENTFFNKSIFEGPARFQNAFFNRKANFMSAKYFDTISFQSSFFNSELQFSAAKFYKYADFTLVDCRGKVLFNYAEFRERANFSHAICMQDFDFVNTQNKVTSFNSARFLGSTRFNKAKVVTSLSFKESFFLLNTPELDIPSEKLILE